MREIKFRAWDREKEEIAKVTSINLEDYEVRMEDEECRRWSAPYPYVCKLMQWTGVKDKHEKEIYEGDIVKTKEHMGQIIYSKGMFFIDVEGDYLLPIYNVSEFMEVIGNIYENPELLERK